MLKVSRVLKKAGFLVLWHGGDLERPYADNMSQRKGRWEFAPGLYLTTNWETARKYAKGGRKLYRITIRSGNDARTTTLPYEAVLAFVNQYVVKSKLRDVIASIDKYKDNLKADTFINILINRDALKSSYTGLLRKLLVDNGVDYEVVDNAFGWGERMVVLFNMGLIVKKEVIGPKTKIEEFDLPTEFKEDL